MLLLGDYERFVMEMFPTFLVDLADLMRPSLVAPVVAWLCHEECEDNGSIIEAAGGWAGKCEWSIEENYRDLLKSLYVAARNSFLLFLNCSALHCLGPA